MRLVDDDGPHVGTRENRDANHTMLDRGRAIDDLSGRPADIAGSGFPSYPTRSSMPASPARGSTPPLTPVNGFCAPATPRDELSAKPAPGSISRNEPYSPGWKERCAKRQSMRRLPNRAASPAHATHSPSTSSNFRELASSLRERTIIPSRSTSAASLRISLPFATPSTTSALVKGARTIRPYPKSPKLLREMVLQRRCAYNLAIACFREAGEGLADPEEPNLMLTALFAPRSTTSCVRRSGSAAHSSAGRGPPGDRLSRISTLYPKSREATRRISKTRSSA